MDSKIIASLAKGNPGAAVFLSELVSSGASYTFAKIKDSGITGTDLYVLYSDLCNKDLCNVIKLVGACPMDILKDACSRQDYSGRILVSNYLN